MSDLSKILPSFPFASFQALLPTIEHHGLTTTDLLTFHPADVAKQTRLPMLDLRRLIATVQARLSDDLTPRHPLAVAESGKSPSVEVLNQDPPVPVPVPVPAPAPASDTGTDTERKMARKSPGNDSDSDSLGTISTLDEDLDAALGGGVSVGSITEFAGESGAGKSQVLLSLCLAVQLPPPHGLGKKALYISTESGLATRRLAQMLDANPVLAAAAAAASSSSSPPGSASLDGILSTVTPDTESQEHILEFQVPVLVARNDIGLVVLDSVAANYRAEFEGQRARATHMAARSAQLVRLGALLRELARRHNLAVVVSNQVGDRFASSMPTPRNPPPKMPRHHAQESPLASRSMPPPPAAVLSSTPSSSIPFSLQDPDEPPTPMVLMLDHQQRWFTGWGDDPHASYALKTPSLGLVWSTQIACRVVLIKRPVYGPTRHAAPITADDEVGSNVPTLKPWRRWMKVVFAPHTPASGQGLHGAVEFEITMAGLKAVKKATK